MTVDPSLVQPPVEAFSDGEIDGLPEPVRRYLAAAIAPGTPLARSARLSMRGRLRVGRWMPFRAREVLNPHRGFVWRARVAGVLTGSDHYADGSGGMEWKLFGIRTVVSAGGGDVSRSACERAGAEAIWLPTALLPRFGVQWTAHDNSQIQATYDVDGMSITLHLEIDRVGLIRSFVFDRWGDPDQTGTWSRHPCGGEATAHATFDGLRIPSAGRLGWFYGTDRWDDGEFFRFRITGMTMV